VQFSTLKGFVMITTAHLTNRFNLASMNIGKEELDFFCVVMHNEFETLLGIPRQAFLDALDFETVRYEDVEYEIALEANAYFDDFDTLSG
jgi:hypothetical protein